jgi:hypothetical protein
MSDVRRSKMFKMYGNEKVGKASCCRECKKKTCGIMPPTSYWHIGSDYGKTDLKILFVGKTPTVVREGRPINGVRDVTGLGSDLLSANFSPFWSYTKKIAAGHFGTTEEDAAKKIAITNMVKCSNSRGSDETTATMKMNCMVTLGVFPKELAILEPKLVICYAGDGWDVPIMGAITLLSAQKKWAVKQPNDSSWNACFNGRGKSEKMWKWVIELQDDGKPKMRFLTTSHPMYRGGEHFVRQIVDWIGENQF